MADPQIPVESSDAKVQDALFDVFSLAPDKQNPLSRATATMCFDAMRSMYTYKDKPKYQTTGKLVTSHQPRGYVVVYIPYVETRMTLPLSPLTQAVVRHCRLSLSQFPPAAVDRTYSHI